MTRQLILSVIWVVIAPATVYGALLAIETLTPGSTDPLWFIVPLFLLVGMGAYYLFRPRIVYSFVLLLVVPLAHLLFSGPGDPAAPGAEYFGIGVEAFLLVVGWAIAVAAHKFIGPVRGSNSK